MTDGHLTVSSLQVANDFRKHHKDVVRAIENLKAQNCALTYSGRACRERLSEAPEEITSELVNAVFGFYRADALKPDSLESDDEEETEQPKRPPVFDWKYDAAFIIGDFRRYYGIDLLSVEYMHWWEFRCLFDALSDDSQCQKRIGYRSTDLSQKKNEAERKRIARIQQRIELPFEMDEDDIASVFEF